MNTIDYGVSIKLLGDTEYEGLFTIENNNITISSLIDTDNYEDMFLELINRGYTKIENNKIKVIHFDKDLVSIFKYLKSNGLDITYALVPF
jgi:hypothetical protein